MRDNEEGYFLSLAKKCKQKMLNHSILESSVARPYSLLKTHPFAQLYFTSVGFFSLMIIKKK